MITEILRSAEEDAEAGFTIFLRSPSYIYVAHRFAAEQVATLLVILALTGVTPWAWPKLVMALLVGHDADPLLLQAVRRAGADPDDLRQAVASVHQYAFALGVPCGPPAPWPTWLARGGVGQETYLAACKAVLGVSPARAAAPWPPAADAPEAPGAAPLYFQTAAALMGQTARAIEHLMEWGGAYGRQHHDE